ncbi:hypothetical protein TNCV_3938041 [Trichonephila clavipes]|nr:hypothetical protein TNCV_3938041 [Trichonephila clavipes]
MDVPWICRYIDQRDEERMEVPDGYRAEVCPLYSHPVLENCHVGNTFSGEGSDNQQYLLCFTTESSK